VRKFFLFGLLFLFFNAGIIFEPAGQQASEAKTMPVFSSLATSPLVSEMEVRATAYGPPLFKQGDLTFSGEPVGFGIIAVDPKVIPLGSVVEIWGKSFLALDTGKKIKGNRIDIWLPKPKQFGCQTLKIKIIKPVKLS